MILAFAFQAALAGIPGFPAVQPMGEERLALPHVADALRATDEAARVRSLDAALALLPEPTRFRAAFQCMRGGLILQGRPADPAPGRAAIDDCYRRLPDQPLAQRMAADVAFARGDYRGGARLLAQAIGTDARFARNLGGDQLDTVFRRLGYLGAAEEARTLAVALSRTDAGRNDPVRLSGWLRASVLERVGKGDLAGARALLPTIVDPDDGLAMLVDRRFAPLWPDLDAWAAGTLDPQRSALAAAVRAGYDARPTLARGWQAAGALARAGYRDEGVALLERAVTAFGAPRDDYDYARAVVRLAKLRAQAGGRDPARVLQPMEAALADGGGRYLLNVVPNLALAQVALGRPAAALATLDRFPSDPAAVETAAAFGYFVAIRGCALAKLGRVAEARAALAEVERRYRTNGGATTLALACGGSDAAVLAGWSATVDDPATRSGALLAMLRARAGAAGDPLSPGSGRLLAIADRPEVAERLARYGRPLPQGYLPALRRSGD